MSVAVYPFPDFKALGPEQAVCEHDWTETVTRGPMSSIQEEGSYLMHTRGCRKCGLGDMSLEECE